MHPGHRHLFLQQQTFLHNHRLFRCKRHFSTLTKRPTTLATADSARMAMYGSILLWGIYSLITEYNLSLSIIDLAISCDLIGGEDVYWKCYWQCYWQCYWKLNWEWLWYWYKQNKYSRCTYFLHLHKEVWIFILLRWHNQRDGRRQCACFGIKWHQQRWRWQWQLR